jgi:CheY-like chemotaxis protein
MADSTLRRVKPEMKTILLAEDSRVTRRLVRDILAADYQVEEVTTGVAALQRCTRAPPPDLLILDLNLANPSAQPSRWLSGLDVVRQLPVFVPFIVLTVDRSQDTLRAAIEAGAWSYCVKPPEPDSLIPAIETALARAEAHKQHTHEALIQRAVGVLMALHHLDEAAANQRLRAVAAAERRKLHEVAQTILQALRHQQYLHRFIETP